MHNQLEQYLSEIAGKLKALPVARRDEELREMRQHLIKLAEANREQGQTEEDAAQAAIRHFGPAKKLGRQMTRAWWRGRLLHWRNGPVGTAVLAGALLYLPTLLVHALRPSRILAPGVILVPVVPLPVDILWCVLIGGYVGWKLTQRTLLATVGLVFCAMAIGTALMPFLFWSAGGGLPHLSLSSLNVLGFGTVSQQWLYNWAFETLFALPVAFISHSWAKRRLA